jgi:hypothetical protein
LASEGGPFLTLFIFGFLFFNRIGRKTGASPRGAPGAADRRGRRSARRHCNDYSAKQKLFTQAEFCGFANVVMAREAKPCRVSAKPGLTRGQGCNGFATPGPDAAALYWIRLLRLAIRNLLKLQEDARRLALAFSNPIR